MKYFLDITFDEQKDLKEKLGKSFNCKFDSNVLCWYTETEPNGDLKPYLIKDSIITAKKLSKSKENILTGKRNPLTLPTKKAWMAAATNIFLENPSCDLCDYKVSKMQNRFVALNIIFKWNDKEIEGYNVFCNDCDHRLLTKNTDYISSKLKISRKEVEKLYDIKIKDYKITTNDLKFVPEKVEEELEEFFDFEKLKSKSKVTNYNSTKDKPLEIYVDGSHKKGASDKKGYGAYLKYNDKVYTLSDNDESPILKQLENLSPKFSNPSAELAGLLHTLIVLSKCKNENIVIYQDYIGVVSYKGLWEFTDKKETRWESKEEHIKFLVSESANYLKLLEKNGNTIELKWIEGHSGNAGNNEADKLAKSGERTNTFL